MPMSQLNIRIDTQVKEKGTATFAELGYTPTQIITGIWEYAAAHSRSPQIVKDALYAQDNDRQNLTEQKLSILINGASIVRDYLISAGIEGDNCEQIIDYDELRYEAYLDKITERGLL